MELDLQGVKIGNLQRKAFEVLLAIQNNDIKLAESHVRELITQMDQHANNTYEWHKLMFSIANRIDSSYRPPKTETA